LISKSLKKYLKNYAESEISDLNNFPLKTTYSNSVLIPVYLENTSFLKRLDTNLPDSSGRIMVVAISNHPLGLSSKDKKQALCAHHELLLFLGKPVWQERQLSLFERDGYDVLFVDRTDGNALPVNQGVGLARKIGADLLVALIHSGRILSPWIMSSDADAFIPKNYFTIEANSDSSAITYPFKHICKATKLGKATELYEKSIKHYVNGLSSAKSGYAFSTLGSCLAFHSESYAQARGFPKRSGGEDFYLLNKLEKLGKVESSNNLPVIKIESRASHRVPFGTGPAVTRLLNSPNMEDEPIFYNPEIFVQLKLVLAQISLRPISLNTIDLNETSFKTLINLGIEKAIEHVRRQELSAQQYDLHMKSWFDGFKTLKFVHQLRDTLDLKGNSLYPSLSHSQIKFLAQKN